MYPFVTTILAAVFLISCSHHKGQKKWRSTDVFQSPSPSSQIKKDTVFWYKEVPQDSSIESNFRIVYGDYKLYFDKSKISKYCDSIIKLNDDRKRRYQNIKQQVNNRTKYLFIDNDFIILTTFRPKIIDNKNNKPGKSLLIQFYKDECDDVRANFYVITETGERVKLKTLDIPACIT